jgi:hypothetical protein
MKTPFLFSLLIAITAFASSCDPAGGTDSTTSQVVTSGSWKVTLFTDSGNDETSDFSGYTFTFSSSGTLSAVKNGITTNGTWNVSGSSNKFNINLGPKVDSNKPVGELTDDWKILSNTETVIRLTDDNASSNEFLTFTKN